MTDIAIMLAHALEKIGALEQRVSGVEVFLSTPHPTASEEEFDDEFEEAAPSQPLHRFNYPIRATADEESPDIMDLRKMRYAQYKITIMQPFADPPQKVYSVMTRDELDDYIRSNPGENFGEWIVEIHMEGL